MATGTTTLNFGTIGSVRNFASVDVPGQTGIVAGSLVEAFLRYEPTAEHPLDDLIYDPIDVKAGNIVAGTGFTVYGIMPYGNCYGNYSIGWATKE